MAHDTHHHKESFITKYIFSQDHKMIAKQYLLTAIFMGAIGITLSALFRMKLGWPDEKFPLLEAILGSDAAPDGLLDSNWYLGLVTLHGTIMVFFVLTGGNAKCAACHGVNAAGKDGVAPPLVHKIYEPSHHGDESFQRAAALGVRAHHWPFGNMPAVEGVTRGDVKMITAYIRELQRANGIN